MEQLKIGFATTEDHKDLLNWIQLRPEFDPSILQYPTLQLLKAYNGESVAFLPVHRALILESSAINPESSDLISGRALMDLVKAAELTASAHKCREIYFLGSDERLNPLAEKYGFQRMEWPLFRMKL